MNKIKLYQTDGNILAKSPNMIVQHDHIYADNG